jgi:hypothetical protein
MEAEVLLHEISDFCRAATMAESTFGRRAVNDGKFVGRLRYGGRVTTATVERVRAFIENHRSGARASPFGSKANGEGAAAPSQGFRFFDNRQKYLLFVNTCSEKAVIAEWISRELDQLAPRPPAIRIFDAGVGDGSVLARVLRALHRKFEKPPLYAVGKEISLEDVRVALEKMPDRFVEHPATCLVMTNLNYAEAPWLTPNTPHLAQSLVWKEVALAGGTAAEFEEQIVGLNRFLGDHWRASVSKKTSNPVYEKPVVLVIYRQDCRFLLDQVIPRRGALHADYDLVIASQPYRARAKVEFKAKRVLAPLARARRAVRPVGDVHRVSQVLERQGLGDKLGRIGRQRRRHLGGEDEPTGFDLRLERSGHRDQVMPG